MYFTYNFESFGARMSTLKDRLDPKKYNFLTNDTLPVQGKLLLIDEAKNMTVDPLITFINEFSKGYDSGIRIKYIYMIIKNKHPHFLHCTPYNERVLPALTYFRDLEFVSLMELAGKIVFDSTPSGPIVTNYGGLTIEEVDYKDIRNFLMNYNYLMEPWERWASRPMTELKALYAATKYN